MKSNRHQTDGSISITPHYSFVNISSIAQDSKDENVLTLNLYRSKIVELHDGKIYLKLNGDEEKEGLLFGLETAIIHSRGVFTYHLEKLYRNFQKFLIRKIKSSAFTQLRDHVGANK